jgi:hypothetical protein
MHSFNASMSTLALNAVVKILFNRFFKVQLIPLIQYIELG